VYTQIQEPIEIATAAIRSPRLREHPVWPADYLELRWYAAYTCANHEKRVGEQLHGRAVEHFLPLYEAVHRWKDRRVRLQLPLFPGYVFVRLALRDRSRVLQIPSVVRLVGFNGQPAALPDEEVEALRDGLARQLRAEPHPYLTVGRRVRILRGPLEGSEGILIRKKGLLRVVLSVDLIMRSVALEIDSADVKPVG
jgi:transcription termination/antitermination protein NusG